jgi:hypothetical protein
MSTSESGAARQQNSKAPAPPACSCSPATLLLRLPRVHASPAAAAQRRQPVRGAHRLPAEDRGLWAHPGRRHRHGRRDALRLHSALPVPRPLGRVPGISVSVAARPFFRII